MILEGLFLLVSLYAQDPAGSSYTENLKKSLPADEDRGSYIENVRKELNEKNKILDSSGYSEKIKNALPAETEDESSVDFSERARDELHRIESENPPDEDDLLGAIESVQKGRSNLRLKRSLDITSAFGLRVGAAVTRSMVGTSAAFSTIYPAAFAPDLTLHYEWKPFHSEWVGSLGVVAEAGLSTYRGNGMFEFAPVNPAGGNFSQTARVTTQLIMLPLSTGLIYRFNLLRVLRPYVQAGPSLIGLVESRSDTDAVTRTYATSYYAAGGVSILLDWMSREMTWDLYAVHGVKHYYLTAEYLIQRPLTGDVQVGYQGVYLGFLMEM